MFVLLPRLLAAIVLASQIGLAHSTPQRPQERKQADNPVTIVIRAEALMQKGEKEDAALMLWRALDLLRGKKLGPIEEATRLSARFLLQENDNLELQRRAAFTHVATLQTQLARSYRLKKWYDTARGRLDVAALYDPDAIGKERTILEAKAKGKKGKPKKAEPKPAAKPEKINNLDRKRTANVRGEWQTVEGELESKPHQGGLWTWTTQHEQAQNQVTLEFRSLDPAGDYNFGLGLGADPATQVGGYRLVFQHFKGHTAAYCRILKVAGMQISELADGYVELGKTKNGYHLVTSLVREDSVSFQIDGHKPIVAEHAEPPRGLVTVMVGMIGITSTAMRFRDLRIDPLPADAPSDEELRQQALKKQQHAITAAVEEARDLNAARKKEPAALLLRGALSELRQMPVGILRDNLTKPIQAMLDKSDRLAKKRMQAAKSCAKALAELADKYALDGRPRLARVLALQARRFDPDGQQQRIAAIDQEIDDWNVAHRIVEAAALAAPTDDGAMLREWFVGGRLLDSRARPWVVDGPSARIDNLVDASSILMPKKGTLPSGTASVHVRLPSTGCQAGLGFDVAGPHDFTVAMLIRHPKELVVHVSRWAGGKWIYLAMKKVPVDAWRLDAWHQLTLETASTGIKVKAAGVELKLDRKRLGDANGRIGLYAANVTNTEATVELRAFQATAR